MLILAETENKLDQAHIFEDTCSESCQIHLLALMIHFEYKNYGIDLFFFYFKIFKNSFRVHVICISNTFHVKVTVKIFFLRQ